jgi:hypothetical protein
MNELDLLTEALNRTDPAGVPGTPGFREHHP